MYEDKIKKELFKKIRYLKEMDQAIEKAEEDASTTADEEYDKLLDKYADLHTEIFELIVESKYYPLVGLTYEQIKELDEWMPKSGKKSKEEEERHRKEELFWEDQDKLHPQSEDIYDGPVQKHLDYMLFTLQSEVKKRIKNIATLRLDSHIDPHTYHIYNEVIRCYIFGAYEASCVLSRSITENVAKRFIDYKGYGYLLVKMDKQLKQMNIQQILKEKIDLSAEVLSLYSKIANKADRLLHTNTEKAGDQEALKTIELLQSFLEKFPRIT